MKKTSKQKKAKKVANGFIGMAGEYFVAAELSRRGLVTTITHRNTQGIDILVSNLEATKFADIQVKTNSEKRDYFMLSEKDEERCEDRFFFVFVDLSRSDGNPNYYVVPGKIVANYIHNNHKEWKNGRGAKGQKRNDSKMRHFHIRSDEFKNRWDHLGFD